MTLLFAFLGVCILAWVFFRGDQPVAVLDLALLVTSCFLFWFACRRNYSDFWVELSMKVEFVASPKAIKVNGTTNLPDGAIVGVTFTPGFYQEVAVKGGQFSAVHFDDGARLYRVRAQFLPNHQSTTSQKIASNGSNLRSRYVSDHPLYSGVRWYVRDWSFRVPKKTKE